MIEKVYLDAILIFFILAFAIKNIKTYLATRQSIRGKSTKLTLSILLSTVIYVVILFRIAFLEPKWIIELNFTNYFALKAAGLVIISIGFVLGVLALISMKNSWRVGIKYDQKTKLITTGIYRFSRNPYFFSYDVLILGYLLIFPSIILFALYIPLTIVFHNMILEEEKYLESVHGHSYIEYKRNVNRYITFK